MADHDPMAVLDAQPDSPAVTRLQLVLRDSIAAELHRRGMLSREAGYEAADVAIRMVVAAATSPRAGSDVDLAPVDAARLLWAATCGDTSPAGRGVRAILPLHFVLPGTGTADPECEFCRGAGEATEATVDGRGPYHCHCACDVCVCGDATCGGPCGTLAALVDEMVLTGGVPAGAVDVPRALLKLHAIAAGRIAARAMVELLSGDAMPSVVAAAVESGERPLLRAVYPDDANGLIRMGFGTMTALDAATTALIRHGFSLPTGVVEPTGTGSDRQYRVSYAPPQD